MSGPHGKLAAQAIRVVTIGVYGYDESRFFEALTRARVDTFCDIRRRRGLRGSTYSFANSQRLQERLGSLGIRYVHMQDLAPSEAVRDVQRSADSELDIKKRDRTSLSAEFVQAYREKCLNTFDAQKFLRTVGTSNVVALFCVEREPQACHRSLVAERLHNDLGIAIEHITP